MLCLPCKEAPRMASVRFSDVMARPTEFLDCTSVALDEFPQLVLPFAVAFHAPSAMSPPAHSRRWRSSWGGATRMGGIGLSATPMNGAPRIYHAEVDSCEGNRSRGHQRATLAPVGRKADRAPIAV